jgi:hypothetical protein
MQKVLATPYFTDSENIRTDRLTQMAAYGLLVARPSATARMVFKVLRCFLLKRKVSNTTQRTRVARFQK